MIFVIANKSYVKTPVVNRYIHETADAAVVPYNTSVGSWSNIGLSSTGDNSINLVSDGELLGDRWAWNARLGDVEVGQVNTSRWDEPRQ